MFTVLVDLESHAGQPGKDIRFPSNQRVGEPSGILSQSVHLIPDLFNTGGSAEMHVSTTQIGYSSIDELVTVL